MVGIVVVSHSKKLAEGVVELSRLIAGECPMAAAGGLEDGSFGTSYEKIEEAINSVYSDDGVVVIMDLGSSCMTTEMVIENMEGKRVEMVDCPMVEGAAAAAAESEGGSSLDEVKQAAMEAAGEAKF
ncbi:MAG: PTS-dependent dihydroxyacetone kinase phosphotransferase subunit DhaM [Lachnospiraceae bacterium]|nr:PTS-dependent dihydroxyacetone kinase phosphotransferase subunit DhaM [Lachnospiraceae bacterium]